MGGGSARCAKPGGEVRVFADEAELAPDIVTVPFDGGRTEVERPGHVLARGAGGEKVADVRLARAERGVHGSEAPGEGGPGAPDGPGGWATRRAARSTMCPARAKAKAAEILGPALFSAGAFPASANRSSIVPLIDQPTDGVSPDDSLPLLILLDDVELVFAENADRAVFIEMEIQ